MQSYQRAEKLKKATSFKFLPYKQLVTNFIALKDEIFTKYDKDRHAELRLLVMDAALRQIKMSPSGLAQQEGDSLFDLKGKSIAFTGILIELRNQINDHFNRLHTSDHPHHSIFSATTNTISYFTGRTELKRAFIESKMNAAIGISDNNQLDDEAVYKINCVLRQLKQWEKFEEETQYSRRENQEWLTNGLK